MSQAARFHRGQHSDNILTLKLVLATQDCKKYNENRFHKRVVAILVPNGGRFFMASTQSGAPGLASAPPLRKFHRLRPGLSLQLACEAGGESSTGLATVDDSLRIVLVLDGRIDVSYGRAALNLVRGQGADAGLVMLREPEECRRVVRGENRRGVSASA